MARRDSSLKHILDAYGYVYVNDFGENNRVQKFDRNGNFIISWGKVGRDDGQFMNPTDIAVDSKNFIYVVDSGNNRIQKFDSNGKFLTKWGSEGSGDGQFDGPMGLIVDPSGYVYVVDMGNKRIQVFAPSNQSLAISTQ